MSAKLLAVIAVAAACAGATGCAGDPANPSRFSTDWLDDQGKSIGQVLARLKNARPAANVDVAVAVAGAKNDKLIGKPLGPGATWSYAHPIDTRPVVSGGVVIGSGGGEIFALDAASGKALWKRSTDGGVLLGAGDDGSMTAVTLAKDGRSKLLVLGRDGSTKQSIDTEKQLGDPAMVGGVAFVPWANQYVSAIDAATGDEIGRVVVRDKVTRALTIGGALYFGEIAYVRFDDKITMASRNGANRIAIPPRELPGTPRLLVPGTEKQPPVANARDRDRIFARPSAPEGPLGIESNRFYASYFRIVIGFESSRGQLAWVHTHAADVIGGEALTGGVLLCDEEGKLVALDGRNGQISQEMSFGEPIKSCVVQADNFKAGPASQGGPSLGAQISQAVSNREATLATAQRLLLRELGTLEDESATKTLIEIASDPRAAPVLVQEARAAIATRRNGAGAMLAALAKHYDFLRDVLASPPVGPIADALAAMKDPKAAPLVASHLLDPHDTDDDVKRAAAALAVLGSKDELPALRQFFAMYRSTAESEDIALAVASVGEALLRIDPKEGRALVEAAAKDNATVPAAKSRLEALLTASKADEKKAPEKK
ncbi:MAG: PQQ-binding-like beta-propeller repeat protein [Deltaproteobacteria bacterium]|nr:PQQ-binding-like beta-propeller repeat protein [Deltaproteobacteria bacterium]